jgi:hypothetical protein
MAVPPLTCEVYVQNICPLRGLVKRDTSSKLRNERDVPDQELTGVIGGRCVDTDLEIEYRELDWPVVEARWAHEQPEHPC